MERGNHDKLNWKEFEKLAGVTESPFFHTDKMKISTMHGIIGIQTEVAELLLCSRATLFGPHSLDEKNFKEELGDILWYVSAVTRAEGWYMDDTIPKGLTDYWVHILVDLQINAGNLVDYVKKSLFYGVEIDILRIRNNVDMIFHHVHNLCIIFEYDMEEIMARNINKLKQRYPEQFTSYHSEARLDKK